MFSAGRTRDRRGLTGRLLTVDPLLSQRVVVEDPAIKSFLDPYLTRDILPSLNAMTGGTFAAVTSFSNTGTIRVRDNPVLTLHGYRITSGYTSDTLIQGNGWRGCLAGLYEWLYQHGCCRLGMGDVMQVTPARSDLRLTLATEHTPLMRSMSWGWQGTVSGLRWPFGSGSVDDYYRHLHENDRFLSWVGRPLDTFVSTDPVNYRTILGIQADAGFRGDNIAALTADPNSGAQFGFTWRQDTVYPPYCKVACNGNTYVATHIPAGISASSGTGPSGTGTGIVDGTCTWNWFEADERPGLIHAAFHSTNEGHGAGNSTDYSGTGGVVGLYKSWLAGKMAANVPAPGSEFEGLELSLGCAFHDGAYECNDDKCVNLLRNNAFGTGVINADASSTDKSLWRNSRIAALLETDHPESGWSLSEYAYDEQTYPPTAGYTVHPRVWVNLVNWGFVAGDTLPSSTRLEMWGARSALDGFPCGIYDFLNLPQYFSSGAATSVAWTWRKFRDCLTTGMISYQAESPFSNGAVGIHYWGMFQMARRGPLSYETLMTEYCALAFGAGAAAMKRNFDRWWSDEWIGFTASTYELAMSFADMREAELAVSSDAASLRRVRAWQMYLVYLHYRKAFELLDAGSPTEAEMNAFVASMLTHVWRDHVNVMVDAIWAHDAALASTKISSAFRTQWTIPIGEFAPSLYPAWRSTNGITDYSDADREAVFNSIRALYTTPTPASFTEPDYTSLIAPAPTSNATLKTHSYLSGGQFSQAGQRMEFVVRPGTTSEIVFSFASIAKRAAYRLTIVEAETGTAVSDELITVPLLLPGGDSAFHTINLSTFAPGVYRATLEQQAPGTSWRIYSCPRDVPIMILDPTQHGFFSDGGFDGGTAGEYAHYFFVPRGVTRFHGYSAGDTHWKIVRPDATTEQTADADLGGRSYRYLVPAGMDHAWWRMEFLGDGAGTPRLLDLPNRFAPTHAQGIIPTNWNDE